MDLEQDTTTAAKMVACSELLRRLEHNGLESTLSETHRLLEQDGTEAVTAYIVLKHGGPVEYDAIARNVRHEDDIRPREYDFAVTVEDADDRDAAAADAARNRLAGLITLHEDGL